jgi:hypothetical protein
VRSRRAHFVGLYSMDLNHVGIVRNAGRALRPTIPKHECAQIKALWPLCVEFVPEKATKSSQNRTGAARETPLERLEGRLRKAQNNSHRCIWWLSSTMVGPMPSPYDGGRRAACARRCRCSGWPAWVNLHLLDFSTSREVCVHTHTAAYNCM